MLVTQEIAETRDEIKQLERRIVSLRRAQGQVEAPLSHKLWLIREIVVGHFRLARARRRLFRLQRALPKSDN
jgi:hypothetical protein